MGERALRTVLVVDDDERILAGFRRGLAREWAVATSTSVSAARELGTQHRFDLAIVDLHLGDGSGVPLVRELKGRHPELRIAVISGYLTTETTVAAVRAGADVVLDKPITPREILRRFDVGIQIEIDVHETPTLAEAEAAHIARVKTDCGGNITETARRLGIHRSSLQRRLRKTRSV